MGLRQFDIQLSDISTDSVQRCDEKYHDFIQSTGWNLFEVNNKKLVSLKSILIEDRKNFDFDENKEYKGIPTGKEYLDEDGEIISHQSITLDNHPNRLKYLATNENILISSLRLAKSPALFYPDRNLARYVFSNGFYIFEVKKEWSIKYVVQILRTKRLKNIIDNHIYRGIGISAYKQEDLLKIKIPLIAKTEQEKIISKIEPIDQNIRKLKTIIEAPQEVINRVFAREFRIDIEKVEKEEQKKQFIVSSTLSFRNPNLRNSARWHKIAPIQKVMYENITCITKLGDYITATKNGWSPNCRENDSLNLVFGVSCISKHGVISYDDMKISDQTRANTETYFAQENDLFVSRGNTTDLVALASVVEDLPDEKNIIFPDLFIRIDVDEEKVSKKYLAYLFNSILGRYYFKYSAKGKNQTMVKVSSDEINGVFLPLPSLDIQQKIIDEIKIELDAQEKIKAEIAQERNKIDEIIENTIKNS